MKQILISMSLITFTCVNAFIVLPPACAEDRDGSASAQEDRSSAALQRQHEVFRRQFEGLEPANIYGLVVDQNSNGVPDVNVRVQWQQATYLIGKAPAVSTDWTTTDKAGRFVFTCTKPDSASVRVSKDGYDCPIGSTGDLIAMKTSKAYPAVIRVRNKGAPTFLVVSPSGINDAPNCWLWVRHGEHKCVPFDICSRLGEKPVPATYTDLAFDAAFDANRVCWSLTVSATNGADGIVLDNDMLYEAPATGYVSKISLVITNEPTQREGVYLYLRSRSPAVYTRFRLEYDHWNDPQRDGQCLRLFYKAWTNPYGERNLEEDERVTENNWRTRKELTAESIQAIRSGRLPTKPDIERRIRETDERVSREEAVKERRHKEWLDEMKKLKEYKNTE